MDCIQYIYTRFFVKVQIIHILLRQHFKNSKTCFTAKQRGDWEKRQQ